MGGQQQLSPGMYAVRTARPPFKVVEVAQAAGVLRSPDLPSACLGLHLSAQRGFQLRSRFPWLGPEFLVGSRSVPPERAACSCVHTAP